MMTESALSDPDVGSVQKDLPLAPEQPEQDSDPVTPGHACVERQL
jgi:hypothetical protein